MFLQYEYLNFHVKTNLHENKLPERMPSNFEIINKEYCSKQTLAHDGRKCYMKEHCQCKFFIMSTEFDKNISD